MIFILSKKTQVLMFTSLFTNILLCLNLTCLIIVPIVRIKLNLLTKQTNINKFFLEPAKSKMKKLIWISSFKSSSNPSQFLKPFFVQSTVFRLYLPWNHLPSSEATFLQNIYYWYAHFFNNLHSPLAR